MAIYIDSLYSNIEKISNIIEEYAGTLEKFKEPKTGTPETSVTKEECRAKFYADLQNAIKDIYQPLNLSSISGEYVNETDFEDLLENNINKIGEIITLLSDQEAEEECDTLLNIVECVRRDLNLYKFQVHLFRNLVNNPSAKIADYDIINGDNAIISDNHIQIELLSDIFHANLNLVFIDREFSLHEQLFRLLNRICHKLEEYKSKIDVEYINILLKKCQILLAKFNYKDNIDSLLQYYNYYNGQDEKITLDVEGSITERLKSIYTKDDKKYKRTISRLYQERLDEYTSFSDFFIKCHYFKNIAKNESLLSDLIIKFESFENQISSSFDKKNASSCLNYLNNCRLSFILKQDGIKPVTVLHENSKIKSVQDRTNVKNYFPFLKIAEWLSEYLSKQIKDLYDYIDLMPNLHAFEDSLNLAMQYLTDSKDNAGCFIPFKPSFEECLEIYTLKSGDKVNIFISSSYIVPVDYEKEEKRIEKLQSSLIKLNAIIEANKSITSAISSLRNENKLLKEDLKDLKETSIDESNNLKCTIQSDLKENQKNNIQILGIFAAIVIFASGTIQIFKGADNVKDATIFMLLFASALSIISLSIWMLSARKEKWDCLKTIVLIILAVILALNTFAIWGDWGKVSINTPSQEKKQSENTVAEK